MKGQGSSAVKKKKSGILIPKTYYQEILSLLFEDLNETERLRKVDYLKRQSMNLVQLQLYWSTRKNYIGDMEILEHIHREIKDLHDHDRWN